MLPNRDAARIQKVEGAIGFRGVLTSKMRSCKRALTPTFVKNGGGLFSAPRSIFLHKSHPSFKESIESIVTLVQKRLMHHIEVFPPHGNNQVVIPAVS